MSHACDYCGLECGTLAGLKTHLLHKHPKPKQRKKNRDIRSFFQTKPKKKRRAVQDISSRLDPEPVSPPPAIEMKALPSPKPRKPDPKPFLQKKKILRRTNYTRTKI